MILRCRLCHASIAAFDPATLRPPLAGAMFAPLAPGFPPPFAEDAPWETVRCPYCRHHPQGYDPAGFDRLDTDQGDFSLQAAKPAKAAKRQTRQEA